MNERLILTYHSKPSRKTAYVDSCTYNIYMYLGCICIHIYIYIPYMYKYTNIHIRVKMLNRLNAPQIGACKSEKGPKSAGP